jgi:hypothetical protein
MQITQAMNDVWAWLGRQQAARLALVLVLVLQVTAFVLPQIPVPSAESVSYNRWLAEFRPLLGDAVKPLASIGLLTLRTSYSWRLTLGFAALLAVANLDRLRDERPEPPSWDWVARLMVCIGGCLIIGGWMGQLLWGWREPEVTAWPGTEIALPERDLAVPQPQGPIGVWPGRYGLYVITRGARVGLQIQAADQEGGRLSLLPSVGEEPRETLRVDFSWQAPEAFFAVPEANLIFRLNQLADRIAVQAYRSASGELLAETDIRADGPQTVNVGEVDMVVTPLELPRYEVAYNPGALVEGVGTMLLAVGAFAPVAGPTVKQAEDVASQEAEA